MQNMEDKHKDFAKDELLEHQMAYNPLEQLQFWLQEASLKAKEPTAMTLATAAAKGRPSARIVYLKGFKEGGLLFYTNYQSRKGKDLESNPYASITFFWPELERQVRIEGKTQKIPAWESEAYFESRPLASRIGAWVSEQSSVIDSRGVLDRRRAYYEERFANKRIRRPKHWGGYVLHPDYYEFWQGRPGRLHDRIAYVFNNHRWEMKRLAP